MNKIIKMNKPFKLAKLDDKCIRHYFSDNGNMMIAVYDVTNVFKINDKNARELITKMLIHNDFRNNVKLVEAKRTKIIVGDQYFVLNLLKNIGYISLLTDNEHKTLVKLFLEDIIIGEFVSKVKENNDVKGSNSNDLAYHDGNEQSHYKTSKYEGNVFSISQIAHLNGMTGYRLNLFLKDKGIQHLVNGQWLLYSRYMKEGLAVIKQMRAKNGRFVLHTYWTEKGLLFINGLLEKDRIEAKFDKAMEDIENVTNEYEQMDIFNFIKAGDLSYLND